MWILAFISIAMGVDKPIVIPVADMLTYEECIGHAVRYGFDQPILHEDFRVVLDDGELDMQGLVCMVYPAPKEV